MGEKHLARRIMLLLHQLHCGTSLAAQAVVDWAQQNRARLWPTGDAGEAGLDEQPIAWATVPALAGQIEDDGRAEIAASVSAAADALQLPAFDRALIHVTTAIQRSSLLAPLRMRLSGTDANLLVLLGMLAGADAALAEQAVRRSKALSLGLLCFDSERTALELSWTFNRALDGGFAEEDRLLEALVGIRQKPALTRDHFVEQRQTFDLLRRLLHGALSTRAAGVNILFHGPPGTGKTEFARTLAASAGAALLAVGECDDEGEEPSRWERLHALKRAQRMLDGRGDTLLLFDEMEDMFSDAQPGSGMQPPSKLFANRLFEANPVPVIWTSNSLDAVDPAHLRRMSFVLRMDHPSTKARGRIVARIAAEEGVPECEQRLAPLVARHAESASIARVAIRGAQLAGSDGGDAALIARSLLLGLNGSRELPRTPEAERLDVELLESDRPIAGFLSAIAAADAPKDFSLLLTGPPGTGKTALAAHLAFRLDRPLLAKRGSDLLSRWVGGTEANIADAFAEAGDSGSVLLFDEADSLLLDRGAAQHNWEVSQVNELLNWIDVHDLPFIAATNHPQRLDPAVMRRFVFKLRFEPLSPDRAALAFERFFGRPAPDGLGQVRGLTPGDFAVVARQLRFTGGNDAAGILRLLQAEAEAKPICAQRVGF